MKKRIEVVCGVFFREQQGVFEVALFQRQDQWAFLEFPGGKIDPGESPEEALHRELLEELSLKVEILGFLGENLHEYENLWVHLQAYWVRAEDWSQLRLHEHSAWEWARGRGSTGRHHPPLLAAADVPLWDLIYGKLARPKAEGAL